MVPLTRDLPVVVAQAPVGQDVAQAQAKKRKRLFRLQFLQKPLAERKTAPSTNLTALAKERNVRNRRKGMGDIPGEVQVALQKRPKAAAVPFRIPVCQRRNAIPESCSSEVSLRMPSSVVETVPHDR